MIIKHLYKYASGKFKNEFGEQLLQAQNEKVARFSQWRSSDVYSMAELEKLKSDITSISIEQRKLQSKAKQREKEIQKQILDEMKQDLFEEDLYEKPNEKESVRLSMMPNQ